MRTYKIVSLLLKNDVKSEIKSGNVLYLKIEIRGLGALAPYFVDPSADLTYSTFGFSNISIPLTRNDPSNLSIKSPVTNTELRLMHQCNPQVSSSPVQYLSTALDIF